MNAMFDHSHQKPGIFLSWRGIRDWFLFLAFFYGIIELVRRFWL